MLNPGGIGTVWPALDDKPAAIGQVARAQAPRCCIERERRQQVEPGHLHRFGPGELGARGKRDFGEGCGGHGGLAVDLVPGQPWMERCIDDAFPDREVRPQGCAEKWLGWLCGGRADPMVPGCPGCWGQAMAERPRRAEKPVSRDWRAMGEGAGDDFIRC